MGQKINPNILRLGVVKHWKTEFFEKKPKELSKYTFKDLELKDYTERFFNSYGFIVHDYRQKFSNSSLILYVSCFVTPHVFEKVKIKKKLSKLLLINNNEKKKLILKINDFYFKKNRSKLQKNLNLFPAKYKSTKISVTRIRKYLILNYYSKFTKIKLCTDKKNTNKKRFSLNFLKTINLFVFNNYNLKIIFSFVNKELKKTILKNNLKQLQLKLKRFKNIDFFKGGFELLLAVIITKNAANLLAKFIANQIKSNKKHKFFLSFLKKILTPLLNSNISVLRGIKIKIKGRLNNAPKAKKKSLIIGNVSVQSINTFIDYNCSAIHSKNGTYGIKVWIESKK